MWFSSLWRRCWRGRPARPDLHVLLYTRAGCHLCDDALAALEELQRRYRFRLEIQEIDGTPDLVALHGDSVPVITVNGKVRTRGRVNPVLLRREFDADSPP